MEDIRPYNAFDLLKPPIEHTSSVVYINVRRGYKASKNGVCHGMTYEVGKTYEKNHSPVMCKYGFHYCQSIDDLFTYYSYKKGVTKIFEIEDYGEGYTEWDKTVTNKIKIVREIPFEEWNTLMNRHVFDDRGNLVYTENLCGICYCYTYDDFDKLEHIEQGAGWEVRNSAKYNKNKSLTSLP